ncbi:MAG: GNAT family N-acetyltransferase, partial [Planctomycetota bacterium]
MNAPTADIVIRGAALADADTIAGFNVALAAETEGKQLDPDVIGRGVQRILTDPALGRYYVAERSVGGRPQVAGQLLVTFEFSDWRDGLFWWIQSVYVRPEARRSGVYRALHRFVEREARTSGGTCGLRLYVDRNNTRAQQVYRSLGMAATAYDLYETD